MNTIDAGYTRPAASEVAPLMDALWDELVALEWRYQCSHVTPAEW
jgi:hypothetical protein